MRDINRIDEVLSEFKKVWEKRPYLRFMQLIYIMQASLINDCFYMEDDKFLEFLKIFNEETDN